jgi:hypothetical protein
MGTGAYAAASEVEEDAERGQDDGEEDLEEGAAPVRRHRRDLWVGIGITQGKGDPSSLLFSRALVALPRLVWFVLLLTFPSMDSEWMMFLLWDTWRRGETAVGSGPSWAVIGDRACPLPTTTISLCFTSVFGESNGRQGRVAL